MESRLEEELNGKELSSEICEKKGIKLYDPFFYKEIESLGQGAFGSVEKCVDIRDRSMVAIKKIKIKSLKKYQERLWNIASFLVESEILKRIVKVNDPNLAKYIGEFYIQDKEGIIEYLILITEAGDFSLKELIKTRLNSRTEDEKKLEKAAYTPDEVLLFY